MFFQCHFDIIHFSSKNGLRSTILKLQTAGEATNEILTIMKMMKTNSRNLSLMFLMGASSFIITSANSQGLWDGGASNDFLNDAENYSNDSLPAGGAGARFEDAALIPSSVLLSQNFDVAAIISNNPTGLNLEIVDGAVLGVRTGGATDFRSTGGGAFSVSGGVNAVNNGGGGIINAISNGTSTLQLDEVVFTGGVGTSLSFEGGGALVVNNSVLTIASNVSSDATLQITDSIINGNLGVSDGGTLSVGGSGTSDLEINGDFNGDGNWLFDIASLSDTDFLDISGNVNLGSTSTLELSGSTSGATTSNPIILAQYDGLLSGTFSNESVFLAPGQRIDYSFNGNQIAIVPEPSRMLPILLGFLPVMFLRARSRRSA